MIYNIKNHYIPIIHSITSFPINPLPLCSKNSQTGVVGLARGATFSCRYFYGIYVLSPAWVVANAFMVMKMKIGSGNFSNTTGRHLQQNEHWFRWFNVFTSSIAMHVKRYKLAGSFETICELWKHMGLSHYVTHFVAGIYNCPSKASSRCTRPPLLYTNHKYHCLN